MSESDPPRYQIPSPVLYGILIFCVICLGALFYPLSRPNPVPFKWVQTSDALRCAMARYASDHGKKYPTGASSTEVFQKLIDGGYISDPRILYIPMQGKLPATSGAKLSPENVSWDVTGNINDRSDNGLPVVFMTGYRVDYAPGSPAIPLFKPFPVYGDDEKSKNIWTMLFNPQHWRRDGCFAVSYLSTLSMLATPDATKGVVPDFRPSTISFYPDGHTYVQLTPDGPVKP